MPLVERHVQCAVCNVRPLQQTDAAAARHKEERERTDGQKQKRSRHARADRRTDASQRPGQKRKVPYHAAVEGQTDRQTDRERRVSGPVREKSRRELLTAGVLL